MLSPTLRGIILEVIIFGSLRNDLGIVLGIVVAAIGLLVGIIWATKIFRSKNGTMHFVSRIDATLNWIIWMRIPTNNYYLSII